MDMSEDEKDEEAKIKSSHVLNKLEHEVSVIDSSQEKN